MRLLAHLVIPLALALGVGAYLGHDVAGVCAASVLGLAAAQRVAH